MSTGKSAPILRRGLVAALSISIASANFASAAFAQAAPPPPEPSFFKSTANPNRIERPAANPSNSASSPPLPAPTRISRPLTGANGVAPYGQASPATNTGQNNNGHNHAMAAPAASNSGTTGGIATPGSSPTSADTSLLKSGVLKPGVPQIDTLPAATTSPNTNSNNNSSNNPYSAGAARPAPPYPNNGVDQYPTIGRLEEVTLGRTNSGAPIGERLSILEQVVFKKDFREDTLFDRTERLKKTILGGMEPERASEPLPSLDDLGASPGGLPLETVKEAHYLDEIAGKRENLEPSTPDQVGRFAIEIVNAERANYGLSPLTPDNLAEKLATTHGAYLASRGQVSHFDEFGLGPDRRYTLVEGTDALTESIASVKCTDVGAVKPCKAAAARLLKVFLSRQDDRDSILSPDATHIGFSVNSLGSSGRFVAVCNVVSRHALMGPLPFQVGQGEKVEVKGVMNSPYVFDRVTLAWEANQSGAAPAGDDGEEALPYFPPLDYVAYSARSEHDYSKAVTAIKIGGMVAAVAGGMFFPPIALAAPLIAVAGSPGEPRPVSDIPVKGGVKLDGAAFNVKLPLNNENKEGLYYVTVWGTLGKGQKSIPISRRVILVAGKPDGKSEGNSEGKLSKENAEQAKKDAELAKLEADRAKKEAESKKKAAEEARKQEEKRLKEEKKKKKAKEESEAKASGDAKEEGKDEKAEEKKDD
ncbi:MAG: CAP domain-containing protein [Candidatus Obscuribacter phosphatis]|uniref:CAP domain-containing protein n=1 Tax=Candidatus Obscuribacter phosphatis TaxID=1906157 RepID=A0A8J7PI73_9BACT|nr:CAP domain-containing protein [Candidatus Obscuribacter phosphatis]